MRNFNEKGAIHFLPLLLVVSVFGLISYLLVSSTAPFGSELLKNLYEKPYSKASTVENSEANLSYPTSSSVPISSPEVVKSTIAIYAAGEAAKGVNPRMRLLVNDNLVMTFNNITGDISNRVFQSFIYTHPSKVLPYQVKIKFDNDYNDKKTNADRNLVVDKINIDGVDYETENVSVFSTGSKVSGRGCLAGYYQSEWLLCNGYFEYK